MIPPVIVVLHEARQGAFKFPRVYVVRPIWTTGTTELETLPVDVSRVL